MAIPVQHLAKPHEASRMSLNAAKLMKKKSVSPLYIYSLVATRAWPEHARGPHSFSLARNLNQPLLPLPIQCRCLAAA